jgi:hypothetical protein
VLNSLITQYCVRYDPYHCKNDPERIWATNTTAMTDQSTRLCHGPYLDFYVPERLITQVLLMDAGLRVLYNKSLI